MIAKKPKNKFVPKRGEEVDEAVNKRMHERKKVSEKYLVEVPSASVRRYKIK